MDLDVIAILGPTASGKTRRAVELAEAVGGEIISCDSRQIYRDMDLGTGKDLEEYGHVPYHLIDIRPAGYKYNLHEYLTDYYRAAEEIRRHGAMPILCGGTGMYAEAVLSGLRLPEVPENPQLRKRLSSKSLSELETILSAYKHLHNTTDIDTSKRAIRAIEIEEYYRSHPEEGEKADRRKAMPPRSVIIALDLPRQVRREKISKRLRQRLSDGMIDEVARLIDSGISPEDLIYYGLEYKFITLHLTGQLSKEEMISNLEIAIHQFAKRQMTWLRGMERRGFQINWLPFDLGSAEFVERVLDIAQRNT